MPDLCCEHEIAVLATWWGDQFAAAYPKQSAGARQRFTTALAGTLQRRLADNPNLPVKVIARRDFISAPLAIALQALNLSTERHRFPDPTLSWLHTGDVKVAHGFNIPAQDLIPQCSTG